ncbi:MULTISPECIES: hypothetical protein [Methylomicrobium]|uniref:hypothetical protein n=1 Tax=Methylomicrobium TaxID=39773 RepID=UPI001FE1C49E|nr:MULTISPECIES: hypothetical protein [Methylomicrobium]
MEIRKVHMGSLQPYIKARKQQGIKSGTIARDLAVVRRILTLSARVWCDENNQPWIDTAPLLQMPNGKMRLNRIH